MESGAQQAAALCQRIRETPKSGVAGRTRLLTLLREADASELTDIVGERGEAFALLAGVAEGSPFLLRLMRQDPARLAAILQAAPETEFQGAVEAARQAACAHDLGTAMRVLRQARNRFALALALADIAGAIDIVAACAALSDFADAAVNGAFGFALAEAVRDRRLVPASQQDPSEGLGLFVLAFGKHGARELNYSSDIDLAIFYDPEASPLRAMADAPAFAAALVKRIVKLLQERTADGYVLRVDLRLRPDPSSTPTAVPLPFALGYYETVGQNWERAAMIKARSLAGDRAACAKFINDLTPFVWRKYFDFATIADIHAMKRQIYAARGHHAVEIAGHDVKIGRGGIREIEFFVQTQQLVYGGRRPILRGARTLDMLGALQAEGWITEEAARELSGSYCFLRRLEHRLQMVDDDQTQRLPSAVEGLKAFARFFGVAPGVFGRALQKHLRIVEKHYARLFEQVEGLAGPSGSLVFTGVEDDPETSQTLRSMGFREPHRVARCVRGWHFGHRPALTSARAREILTELVPVLLQSFARSGDPDGAVAGFDEALAHLPAAAELFSILLKSAPLRALFADILGSAPQMAEMVTRAPHVLDAVLDPDFARPLTKAEIVERAHGPLERESEHEMFYDRARELARAERFLVAARVLSGTLLAEEAGLAYTAIADAFLGIIFERVRGAFLERHGAVPGAKVSILGYGKLGTGEMTATSDLDLVVVYDAPPDAMSDGAKPLFASEWHARLTQRLVAALSAPMRNGVLYEIDLRLRPSGRKGPLAVSLSAFRAYQRDEAEVWEQMALTRVRPVAGDAAFMVEMEHDIGHLLAAKRDRAVVRAAVRDMRRLIEAEKAPRGMFDVKRALGGLIDLEFLAAYLVLTAVTAGAPAARNPGVIFAAAREDDEMSADDAELLIRSWRLQTALNQFIRMGFGPDFDLDTAAVPVKRRLAALLDMPDFAFLRGELQRLQQQTRVIFDAYLTGSDAPVER